MWLFDVAYNYRSLTTNANRFISILCTVSNNKMSNYTYLKLMIGSRAIVLSFELFW